MIIYIFSVNLFTCCANLISLCQNIMFFSFFANYLFKSALLFCSFFFPNAFIAKNNAVEASASDIDYEAIASNIQAGDCYKVMNCWKIRIRGQYKVMPHSTQLIFTAKIVFRKLSVVFPPIP